MDAPHGFNCSRESPAALRREKTLPARQPTLRTTLTESPSPRLEHRAAPGAGGSGGRKRPHIAAPRGVQVGPSQLTQRAPPALAGAGSPLAAPRCRYVAAFLGRPAFGGRRRTLPRQRRRPFQPALPAVLRTRGRTQEGQDGSRCVQERCARAAVRGKLRHACHVAVIRTQRKGRGSIFRSHTHHRKGAAKLRSVVRRLGLCAELRAARRLAPGFPAAARPRAGFHRLGRWRCRAGCAARRALLRAAA